MVMKTRRRSGRHDSTPDEARGRPEVKPSAQAGAAVALGGPLEHWRKLASGQRGVRLYHVTLPAGGVPRWETELTLSGRQVHRRFASELHARAWLSVATQHDLAVSSVEREELNRPVSASCFAEGS
jgi:hypothetical protein